MDRRDRGRRRLDDLSSDVRHPGRWDHFDLGFDPSVPVSGAALVTPGFPDHPAGHTCVSAATVRALRAFFGTDEVAFTAVSNKCSPAPCPNRSFDRFSDALEEIINARVWGGIHFRTADEQGATLGRKIVKYMRKHYFRSTG